MFKVDYRANIQNYLEQKAKTGQICLEQKAKFKHICLEKKANSKRGKKYGEVPQNN